MISYRFGGSDTDNITVNLIKLSAETIIRS